MRIKVIIQKPLVKICKTCSVGLKLMKIYQAPELNYDQNESIFTPHYVWFENTFI